MKIRASMIVIAASGAVACASSGSTGAGPAPSPAVETVLKKAATPPATAPAPVPAPPAVKNMDPVGTYSVSLISQGNPLNVTLKIVRRDDGTFGGTVVTGVTADLPINSVTVNGNTMKVHVAGPGGEEALINITVNGDTLSGDWAMANDGSPLSGKKLP